MSRIAAKHPEPILGIVAEERSIDSENSNLQGVEMVQTIHRGQFNMGFHPARKVWQETDRSGSVWLVVRCPKCRKLRRVAADLQKDKTIWDVMSWLQRREWQCVVCEKWASYLVTHRYNSDPPPNIV